MIVMKYGGIYNQDAAALRNVVSIIPSHLQDRPAAVISTIARVTIEHEHTARLATAGKADDGVAFATRLFESLLLEFFAGQS